MCASYWNLDTKMKCPGCGKTTVWNLQTHFMGYLGSCANYYKLGEKVHGLAGIDIFVSSLVNCYFSTKYYKKFSVKNLFLASNLSK